MQGGPRDKNGDETTPADTFHGERTLEAELAEELAVLHRVFRHDFRNRLNVIMGHAELARKKTDSDELVQNLETVLEHTDSLTQTVEQVSVIQDLASSGYSPDTVDIVPTLRELIAECDQSAATFETSIPDSVWVWMNPSYEVAFRELIENAVVHNDALDPRVTVRVKQGKSTEVIIADNGPGMPERTKQSLKSTDVDQTDHLSSLGLWTAYWILTRSGATLAIEENEPRGCQITLSLRSASPPAK